MCTTPPSDIAGQAGYGWWIDSIIDTIRGPAPVERHGAHTLPGLITRVT